MKLYLDLDGVFADFESAVRRLTGENYCPKISWAKLEKVNHFYKTLYPLSGALRLYDTIKYQSTVPVEILTSIPDPTGFLYQADWDKKRWVRHILDGEVKVNCVRGWEMKSLFTGPGNILVDDSWRNIKDWVACGGIGIHHTSNWNTINQLRMTGVFK